jgi:hypothetical protein
VEVNGPQNQFSSNVTKSMPLRILLPVKNEHPSRIFVGFCPKSHYHQKDKTAVEMSLNEDYTPPLWRNCIIPSFFLQAMSVF